MSKNNATPRKVSVLKFLICIVIALGMTFALKQPEFNDSQVYVIFLLFFAIGLWFTEAIPAFAVSLLCVAFLVFALGNPHFNSAPERVDVYVNTFSSSVIWLMLGGFFLAAAMTKTKLDEALLRLTFSVSGKRPRNLLIGLMLTTMIASMLMSNTATAAMVIAAITPLISSLGKESGITKAFLLGVPVAASTGGIATIIGSPPNAIAVGALDHEGIHVDFLQWMMFGLPLALVLTAISCIVLISVFLKDNAEISMDFMEQQQTVQSHEMIVNRRIVIVILIATIGLWLTGSLFGITVASVTAVPLVFLTLTGIIDGKDVRSLPWDTLLLVAGGLSLGVALNETGLLSYYADKIVELGLPPKTYLFILAYLTMICSNVMSHTATSTVLIPLGLVILSGFQKEASLIIAMSASTAMFLPVSTPPNAIAFSSGFLELKDFRLNGILIGLLGPLIITLWVIWMSH